MIFPLDLNNNSLVNQTGGDFPDFETMVKTFAIPIIAEAVNHTASYCWDWIRNYLAYSSEISLKESDLVNEENAIKPTSLPRAVVNLPCDICGMFSVFHYLLGVMRDFEANKYSGLAIDFKDQGLYYDIAQGENWWNYYFEPIDVTNNSNGSEVAVKSFDAEYMDLAASVEGVYEYEGMGMSREEANFLFQKYFKVKKEIREKIDRFAEMNFSTDPMISVHYRGTDKVTSGEARKVSHEEMIAEINRYIKEHRLENFQIFCASDEALFCERFQKEFPGKVVLSNAKRSTNGSALHFNAKDPYKMGEEALIDCLLLARGDVLIRTSSNLSTFAKYINPEMGVIEVSKRWGEDNPSSWSTLQKMDLSDPDVVQVLKKDSESSNRETQEMAWAKIETLVKHGRFLEHTLELVKKHIADDLHLRSQAKVVLEILLEKGQVCGEILQIAERLALEVDPELCSWGMDVLLSFVKNRQGYKEAIAVVLKHLTNKNALVNLKVMDLTEVLLDKKEGNLEIYGQASALSLSEDPDLQILGLYLIRRIKSLGELPIE